MDLDGRRAMTEAAFHDDRVRREGAERARLRYAYVSVTDVYEFTRLPQCLMNKRVLEVGCFCGEQARLLTGFKGRYLGIDISSAAIDVCRKQGLAPNFVFEVDDANYLRLVQNQSIDYAFGQGVLHHLDLKTFSASLAAKLAPGGLARFVEPAQGGFALRLFRRLSPKLRTPDERPLDESAIQLLSETFSVRVTYHALLRPLLPMLSFNASFVMEACKELDRRLLKSRFLQSQAWLMQLELRLKTR